VTDHDRIVLVNGDDVACGESSKLAAHEPPGILHRAFSVVLFRPDGKVLIQQRAEAKYHFPLHWANACCSHPSPGESVVVAANRRLFEELGVKCVLEDVGSFVYRATCPSSGLVEHEFDHVLIGLILTEPRPDPLEVAAIAWVEPLELNAKTFGTVAPWLAPALEIATRAWLIAKQR
jgi:isopentenyl-diphosphate delta-isomerase